MTDDLQQITNIRNQTLQQLADLRSSPKPTYSIDGQKVSWDEYAHSLQDTIDWCDEKLAGFDPFEVQSRGAT